MLIYYLINCALLPSWERNRLFLHAASSYAKLSNYDFASEAFSSAVALPLRSTGSELSCSGRYSLPFCPQALAPSNINSKNNSLSKSHLRFVSMKKCNETFAQPQALKRS